MPVLVTGGAGYIGSHVVLALIKRGEAVVVLDNLSAGFRRLVPEPATFALGDVGDIDLLNRLIAEHWIDAIMHFAGSVVVPESVADPLGYYFNNTVKSHALIQAALANEISHFIFSSSAAVYGTPASNPITEDAALRPISPYGSSKMMTETMLADVSRASDLRYVALRYFNVAGADPQGRSGQCSPVATHLIKVACQVVHGRRPHLEIFGVDYSTPDGTCIRDYIHVTDLAQAHLHALSWLRKGSGSLVINCGYGRGYSVLEVVDAMKRASGTDFKVVFGPRRAGDPPSLVAGVGLIGETLGWKPRFNDLELIANHALTWERTLEH
jgi:UDP-glucose 4-epimerase